MRWAWRIGTILGIDIRVHITFVLALVWGGFLWGNGGLYGAVYGVFLTLVLFGIVILHELGHSLVARRYGIPVYDIVLLPIGGMARLGHMPEEPRQELVVALAGPLVNLALVFLTLPLLVVGVRLRIVSGATDVLPSIIAPGWFNFVSFLFAVNVTLFVFNMLPAFPMDGGRVLRALLAMKLSYARATSVAVTVGRLCAVGFGVFGIATGNILLAIVALFVFNSAGAEGRDVQERESRRTTSASFQPKVPVLLADTPAHQAFDRLLRSPYPALAVVSQNGEFVGLVTRTSMERRWAAGIRGPVSLFIERQL